MDGEHNLVVGTVWEHKYEHNYVMISDVHNDIVTFADMQRLTRLVDLDKRVFMWNFVYDSGPYEGTGEL